MKFRWLGFCFKMVLFGIMGLAIALLMFSAPGWSKSTPNRPAVKASVVLDGRVLLEVSQLQRFDAQTRADAANTILAEMIQQADNISRVEVVSSSPMVTLRIQNRHLLTVTEQDVLPGVKPLEQARIWQRTLNQGLSQARLERSPRYQRQALWQSLGLLIGVIAAHLGIRVICRRLTQRNIKHHQQKYPERSSPAPRSLSLIWIAIQGGLWLATAFLMTERFPWLREWRYRLWFFGFSQPLFTLNAKVYRLTDLFVFLALVFGLWVVVRGLTLILKSRILKFTGVHRGLQEAIAILSQYFLTLLGLIVILQVLGVDISSVLFLGGALGVGIGFGLQNIVHNFISGIILLVERSMEVGDFIHIGTLSGTVERIGARSTEIRSLDQVSIIVPNAHFLDREMVNWSHGNPVSQIHLPIGLAYGSSVETVKTALLDAVSHHPDVLAYPQPQIRFHGFGDSALNFEILAWICDPLEQFRIKSDLYFCIEKKLKQYDLEVPFPQRDLHLRSPQIEQMIALWMQQHSTAIPSLYIPQVPSSDHPNSESTPVPSDQKIDHPRPHKRSTHPNLEGLAEQMRGVNGIEIKDRRYRLNVYPQCFVGSEAVAWLMRTQRATRTEAIRIGQLLLERGIIHHVVDAHPFEDSNLFYRFYSDEQIEGSDH